MVRLALALVAAAVIVAGFGALWYLGGGTAPDGPSPAASCYTRAGSCPTIGP